jgi:hypothetical protein
MISSLTNIARFDQCSWLQQQLRVVREVQKIKSQYFKYSHVVRETFKNELQVVKNVHERLTSAVSRTCRALQAQKRSTEAIMLFQILANNCEPTQPICSSFPPGVSAETLDLFVKHIDNLYEMGAVGMAASMQETLISETSDYKLSSTGRVYNGEKHIEREIDKLIKFENEFSQRIPQILTKLNLHQSAVFQSLPLLHRQSLAQSRHCVEKIIARRYQSPHQTDSIGRTALHIVFENGDSSVLPQLFAWQVPVTTKDFFGRTPLHIACFNGAHTGDISKLLKKGSPEVDVDSKDRYGRTPLLLAAVGGHEAVVKLLLATGQVDVDLKDGYGRTPLSFAAEGGHEAVVELLKPNTR